MGDKETIIEDLIGKSSVRRRKACVAAVKLGEHCFCEALFEALQVELNSKSWQTRAEVIKTIGLLSCSMAKDQVKVIALAKEPEFDMVKKESALAYVRLAKGDLADVDPVMEILRQGTYSAVEGGLEALGYDRMVPSDRECTEIIEKMWDYGSDRPKGYTDPRYGLAAACAGWKSSSVKNFLEHCLSTNDVPLMHVAKNSLKQKYVKLR